MTQALTKFRHPYLFNTLFKKGKKVSITWIRRWKNDELILLYFHRSNKTFYSLEK